MDRRAGPAYQEQVSARRVNMLGWTILFAVPPLCAFVVTLAGRPMPLWLKIASLLLAMLFVLSLLPSVVGRQARY